MNGMKPSEAIVKHRAAIRQMLQDAGLLNPRFFGSAVRGNDSEGSDLDILVDPSPETSLLDLAKVQLQIESAIGIRVDLLTPKFLPESFRDKVLQESVVV